MSEHLVTLYGRPVVPCPNPDPHPWHGDGSTYCLGRAPR